MTDKGLKMDTDIPPGWSKTTKVNLKGNIVDISLFAIASLAIIMIWMYLDWAIVLAFALAPIGGILVIIMSMFRYRGAVEREYFFEAPLDREDLLSTFGSTMDGYDVQPGDDKGFIDLVSKDRKGAWIHVALGHGMRYMFFRVSPQAIDSIPRVEHIMSTFA